MKVYPATILLFALAACGADAEPNAPITPSVRAVYDIKVEYPSSGASLPILEPSDAEKAEEVSRLENEFRPYEGNAGVRATYRFLRSGGLTLIERATYLGASPAYAHYMGLKGDKLVSIVCIANKPIPGAVVSSSNCADAVGNELGPEYLALITGEVK